MNNPKLIRITTVPISLRSLLQGQHKYMSENGFEVIGVSSSGKSLQEVTDKEEVRTVAIEMTRKITPLKDFKALIQLIRLMRKEKPDIVHTHTPKAGLLGMLASRFTKVPNRLHTIAGLPLMESTGVKRSVLLIVEKITYLCATKLYPISYGIKEFVIKENLTAPSKLKVLKQGSSNGVDLQRFDPTRITNDIKNNLRNALGIINEDFVFLFVGRVVGDKGVNELVEAFKKIQTNIPNRINVTKVHLVLVGNEEKELDPLRFETKKEIESNPNIHAVGYKTNVEEYFAIADVLTFPSYREGFGNVTAQAGAMELPAIVSDISGSNEIIEDGVNGLIIPPKDTLALFTAMQKIMLDIDLYYKIKQNTRKMIVSRYDQKEVWKALLQEYKALLGEKVTK